MKHAPDACELCGLPLRHGSVAWKHPENTFHFCCLGCKQVFRMLAEAGDPLNPANYRQSALFQTCLDLGIIPSSEAELKRRAAQAGDPEDPTAAESLQTVKAPVAAEAESDTIVLNLRVDGMWCPACAWVIEQALNQTKGVISATCNFSTDRVRCRYDPVVTTPDRIKDAIQRFGYTTTIFGSDQVRAARRKAFVRLGITAFLSMNVMMFSFALYSGYFSQLPQDAVTKLSWPIAIMATVVLIYGGQAIAQRAWFGIVHASPGMESLIAIGAISAYGYSLVNLLAGRIDVYFDTAAMLITLVLIGKMLETRAKRQIHEDLDHFFALQPRKVRLVANDTPQGRYVSIDQLRVNDRFQVEAPEIVPADGLIMTGTATIDQASITGEATPVMLQSGQRIRSGSRLLEGQLEIHAEAVGPESTLGQMIHVMEEALRRKTPLEGRTDLVLKWFVPTVVAIALGTGLVVHALGFTLQHAVVRAITVMVISCPCALGLAIPLARVTGIALAAKKGLLVRNADAFEQAVRLDTVIFDKTGTITEGQWELRDIVTYAPCQRQEALALAAGLEADSRHPVGAVIRRQARREGVSPALLQDIDHRARGIGGMFKGHAARIGSTAFSLGEHAAIPTDAWGTTPATQIHPSRVWLSIDRQPCALFVFSDRLRQGAPAAAHQLLTQGHDVHLVSGDDHAITQHIAQQLDIAVAQGGLLPLDKSRLVADLQSRGKLVAMVGDGVNDAPALAQSDLAVALYAGGHLAPQTSDITLMRGDPQQVVDFIDLARLVNRKVYQNLWGALIYNIIAIPIAAMGWLSPLVAVSAMLLSSLTVIGNTLLMRRTVLSATPPDPGSPQISAGGSAKPS